MPNLSREAGCDEGGYDYDETNYGTEAAGWRPVFGGVERDWREEIHYSCWAGPDDSDIFWMFGEWWVGYVVGLEDTEWEGEACSISQIGISHEEVYYLPHIKASNTKHPARKSQACMPPSALGTSLVVCAILLSPSFSASFSCPSSIANGFCRTPESFEDSRVNSTMRDAMAWTV